MNTVKYKQSVQHINRLLGVLTTEVSKLQSEIAPEKKSETPTSTQNQASAKAALDAAKAKAKVTRAKPITRVHLSQEEKELVGGMLNDPKNWMSIKEVAQLYGISVPNAYNIKKNFSELVHEK